MGNVGSFILDPCMDGNDTEGCGQDSPRPQRKGRRVVPPSGYHSSVVQKGVYSMCNETYHLSRDSDRAMALSWFRMPKANRGHVMGQPYGLTMPVHVAVAMNNLDGLEELLCTFSAKDVEDHYGRTALHIAAWQGNLEAAKILLSAGANPEAKTKDGLTPIEVAADAGCGDLVHFLMVQHPGCSEGVLPFLKKDFGIDQHPDSHPELRETLLLHRLMNERACQHVCPIPLRSNAPAKIVSILRGRRGSSSHKGARTPRRAIETCL